MKKIILLLTLSLSLLTLVVNAQTPPNAFNYSAVARNAAGQPIATTTIGIQITILKTSPTGASQYSENHFINTDAFGLFNLVIGAGAVQSGSMATIDWSNDNYYLKVGMDAAGGTNFLIMGTTQLLSVPYAMYAKSAGSLSGIPTSVSSNLEFPDGINGMPFFLNLGSTYTVPTGKNLYGLKGGAIIGQDTIYGGNGTIIPENTSISLNIAWMNSSELFFLVDKTVDVVLWQSWNTFTVPNGFNFYINLPCGNAGGCQLIVNGNIWNGYQGGNWYIFPAGTTLQFIVDQGQYHYLATGYLK